MKLSKQKLKQIIKEELEEAYGGALGSFPERYGDAHKRSTSAPPAEELDDEWFGPPPGDLYMEADEAILKVILDDLTGERGLDITRPEIAEPIAGALVRIANEIREGAGLGK